MKRRYHEKGVVKRRKLDAKRLELSHSCNYRKVRPEYKKSPGDHSFHQVNRIKLIEDILILDLQEQRKMLDKS